MKKNMKGQGFTRFIPLISFLLLILPAVFLFRSFSFGMAPSVWDHYYLLLVPKDNNEESVVKFLKEGGIEDVLSYSGLDLSYSSFDDNLSTVPAEEAFAFFEAGDPRYDPFFKSVRLLFSTDKDRVYYISDSNSIFSLYRLCSENDLFERSWKIVDWNLRALISVPLIFLIYISLLILISGKKIVPVLAGGVPFLYITLIYGYSVLPAAILLHFSWFLIANRIHLALSGEKKDFFRLFLFAVVLVSASVMFYQNTNRSVLSVLLVNIYMGVIPGLGFRSSLNTSRILRKKTVPEHTLFEPIPLLGEERRPIRKASERRKSILGPTKKTGILFPVLEFLPLLTILLAVAAVNIDMGEVSYTFPSPQKEKRVDKRTLEDIKLLYFENKSDETEQIPNISNYIAHRVFQDFFLYNPEYGIPFKKDTISVSTFVNNGGKIVKKEQESISFDKEWFKKYLTEMEKDKIGRFYMSQRSDSPIVYTNNRGGEKKLFSLRSLIFYLMLSGILFLTLFDIGQRILNLVKISRERFKRCEN